jgi:death-on-curing protein
MTDFLTVAEVLAMHTDQIERYGGSHGVRDPGLLEAALYRPQTGYYADLIRKPRRCGRVWRRTAHRRQRARLSPPCIPFAINGARLTADAQRPTISSLRSISQPVPFRQACPMAANQRRKRRLKDNPFPLNPARIEE